MLVPAMNNKEITTEILRDLEKLNKSTVNRLIDEYDRERRKFKIDKAKAYPKDYQVKTASKNSWIIFLQKSPSLPKYRDAYDAVGCCVVYYYSTRGLKVLRYNSDSKYMEIFNGHFFARYNERLQLNLNSPVEVIKRFFHNSGYLQPQKIKKDGREYTMAVCREGMALGEYHNNSDLPWLVHKTFIHHDLKGRDQRESEKKMMTQVQLQLLLNSFKEENDVDSRQFINSSNTLSHIMDR